MSKNIAGYLTRWHVIPRNRFFNIYLHKFTGDDDNRALHDHPWHSFSILLKGEMNEMSRMPPEDFIKYGVDMRDSIVEVNYANLVSRFRFRRATFAHRLELLDKTKPAWTLFITGPAIREWGFHCSKGWQHWSTMTTKEGETIGGCNG